MKLNYRRSISRRTLFISMTVVFTAVFAFAQEASLHVSTSDAMKAATSKVQPNYPEMARQLRLEGVVEVEAHITEDGSVDSVKPLTGNAVLMNAAVAAMKRWKFTPFAEGGKAVKAIAPIAFTFKL